MSSLATSLVAIKEEEVPPAALTEKDVRSFEAQIGTTGDALFKYRKEPEAVPSELERLHYKSQEACHQYLERLLPIYAFEGRPRLPYIPFMDHVIYAKAQEALDIRFKNNGKKPLSSLPPEVSLLEALRQSGIEALKERPAGFFGYGSSDGECQWKPERNAAWMYKFLCGPKLCGYKHGETCPHGYVFCKGIAPEGWINCLGWKDGTNPFQGAYTGPTSGFPSAAAISSTGADSSLGSSISPGSTRAGSEDDAAEEPENEEMETEEMETEELETEELETDDMEVDEMDID